MSKEQKEKNTKAEKNDLQEYWDSLNELKEFQIVGRTQDGVVIDKGTHLEEISEKQYKYGGGITVSKGYKATKGYKTTEDYTTINYYQLHFEKEAMIKILLCMDKFAVEFGGFLIGTIDNKKHIINIEEIFLPRQSVSGAECVFNDEDEAFVINKFQDKYLGIFHSHNNMGAFFSTQDEKLITDALMLKGTRFLSVVISESSTLIDRLTTIDMNKKDNLLNKMLETEFIGHLFERTLKDEFIKQEINRVTVDDVDISEDELKILKEEIDKFHKEVKNIKIESKIQPLGTIEQLRDTDFHTLIYEFGDLIEHLFEMETSKISLMEAFIKISSDTKLCSEAIDFFASAEEIRESFLECNYDYHE